MTDILPLVNTHRFLAAVNPYATHGERGARDALQAARYILGDEIVGEVSYDKPTPTSVSAFMDRGISAGSGSDALLISSGGDSTVTLAVAAALGIVEDNPDATENNVLKHEALLTHLTYFGLARGRSNNFQNSAAGIRAQDIKMLAKPGGAFIGYHRPLLYRTYDQNGEMQRLGIATSGIGLGGPEKALSKMAAQKPELARLSAAGRLLKEVGITFQEILYSEPFSADVSLVSGNCTQVIPYNGVTALETIGTRHYATAGRTSVNVDDTRWQYIINKHHTVAAVHAAHLAESLVRLQQNKHVLRPVDLDKIHMSVEITSSEGVSFHVDGDTSTKRTIEPGGRLELSVARLALPVLMFRE